MCQSGHHCRSWVCLAGTSPSPKAPIPASCCPLPGPPREASLEHTGQQRFPCGARALSGSQGQHPNGGGCMQQAAAGRHSHGPMHSQDLEELCQQPRAMLASKDRSNTQNLHRRVQYTTGKFLCAALPKASQSWCRHAALGIWSKPVRK